MGALFNALKNIVSYEEKLIPNDELDKVMLQYLQEIGLYDNNSKVTIKIRNELIRIYDAETKNHIIEMIDFTNASPMFNISSFMGKMLNASLNFYAKESFAGACEIADEIHKCLKLSQNIVLEESSSMKAKNLFKL